MKLLTVLIEHKLSSIDTPFTYVCNDDENIKIGCRVYVPFKHSSCNDRLVFTISIT